MRPLRSPLHWPCLLGLVLPVSACRSSSDAGSRTVVVHTFAGERAEPDARVIGHAPDGQVIDETVPDAVGRAEVGVDDDSLITVVFSGTPGALTPTIAIVTLPAPAADVAEVNVHGPARTAPPLTIGVLQVDGPPVPGATYFEIRTGCATVRVASLPASVDIGACSMGSDAMLDVLVAGYHDLGGELPPIPVGDGYAAGRVPMTGGVARLDIASWHTTTTAVPVMHDGVMPTVTLQLFSDGMPFDALPVQEYASLWTGLVVDAARIQAILPGGGPRITTRQVQGAPTEIAFGAGDFLSEIDVTATVESLSPTTLAWQPGGLGDAVNLYARWDRVVWNAVLPPDASSVTLPDLDGLGTAITPARIEPVDVMLRYVDSTSHDGFAALVADGVRAEDTEQPSTIARRPPSGDIRVCHALGLR